MTGSDRQDLYSVSVVIPAYNVEKFVARAIDSVLSQTRRADEIIVVDDGSTDSTAAEVSKFGPRIRFVRQENAGASAARNAGIEAATSEWIAFLDADDEWLPEKLQLQIEHLKRNPDLVWTTANFYRCLCNENRHAPNFEPDLAQKVLGAKEYFKDFFRTSLPHICTCTDTMLIKKKILQQAGMFRVGQLMANDIDMWFRIAYRWPVIGFISKPLAVYHMTIPQSISQKCRQFEIKRDLFRRHLKLAAEHNRLDVFKICVGRAVTSWIRSLLFENRPGHIRQLMAEFDELLTRRFKMIIGALLIFPRATAVICHMISRVVRVLHLRRHVMRRPLPPQKTDGC